jgi:hypothetical protein
LKNLLKSVEAMDVFDIVMKKPAEVSRSGILASLSMTMSNTPIVFTDFSRFFYVYIKHTHRFDGFQQDVP